jgi:addiction module HigA family antidote
MAMHNPPHPGEFIKEVYLEPLRITPRRVALQLKVSPTTFSRLLKGQSKISSEMALRLSKCLGRSPASWLAMQNIYDLWQAKDKIDLADIEPLSVTV